MSALCALALSCDRAQVERGGAGREEHSEKADLVIIRTQWRT